MLSRYDDAAFRSDRHDCDVKTDKVGLIFQVLNFAIIGPIINVFGSGTNIINMVCFVKQGIKDPVNITFIGLTISELLSMATLIWNIIYLNPLYYESAGAVMSPYITQLITGTPHAAFTRVTCCITAFLSLERCLCVVLPLKVQLIFTAKKVIIIVITIYIVILTSNLAPVYYTTRFTMLPHPYKPNSTWLSISFTEDQSIVEKYSFAINNCFIPLGTFTIISVSTVITAKELRRKAKWRKTTTAPGSSDSVSSRDVSLSKMIVLMSTMFVICYTPVCLICIGMIFVSEFSICGLYKTLTCIFISFSYILESVNASFNICIYYNMSSRYRETFRKAVCFHRVRDQNNAFWKSVQKG